MQPLGYAPVELNQTNAARILFGGANDLYESFDRGDTVTGLGLNKSIIAAVYALTLTMFIYKEIKIRDLPRILWETLESSVRVLFIISAAGIFGWLLIHQKVPEAHVFRPRDVPLESLRRDAPHAVQTRDVMHEAW